MQLARVEWVGTTVNPAHGRRADRRLALPLLKFDPLVDLAKCLEQVY